MATANEEAKESIFETEETYLPQSAGTTTGSSWRDAPNCSVVVVPPNAGD